ncbi:MAG: aquaporin family protein [Acidimicrobiia bacterium]|nr:aquaporin family protein [Acidimicrobiia bacterium]
MRARPLLGEFLGTAMLVAGVVGSGIMAETLSPDDVGLQLLENAAATAAVLYAIIVIFMPVSGASFNPAVTLAAWLLGHHDRRDVVPYIAAQVAGGIVGAIVANLMFDLAAVDWSTKSRTGADLLLGEVVATVGLLLVVFSLVRTDRMHLMAGTVAAYIGGAYFFTSSTSFANPAVTIGRMFSDTFAGIEPTSAPGFVAMQLVGVALIVPLVRFLYPSER